MKAIARTEPPKPEFIIRVHLTDGSLESFAVVDEAEARRIWEAIEPARLFAQPRLVLAGEHFKSVFVTSHVLRVDFVNEIYECWEFPNGYADVVELSESEFKKNARLDQPDLMAKRNQPIPVGDLLVSFLKLYMTGGRPLFLMTEFPVKLPAENQSFMRFLLSKGGFHVRLRAVGTGVVNLAHVAGFTAYPGLAQVPSDTWFAEPLLNKPPERR
jgi:hypothetical protein